VNYRSVADLNDDVVNWIARLPRDFDLIVGVPRSGLLVANLLSLHLNLPLADVDGLVRGATLGAGHRLGRRLDGGPEAPLKVLVVDDSIWSGRQLAQVRRRIEAAGLPHEILYGAVYALPAATDLVDYYYEKLDIPRAFEWNILHHPYLNTSCVVADGLLWPAGAFETKALPLPPPPVPQFLPTQEIGWLIADAPEACHGAIEDWLARHEVRYRALVLLGMGAPSSQSEREALAGRKAAIYRRAGAWIFVEPDQVQAVAIANLTSRPVFCAQTRQMIYPGIAPGQRRSPLLRHQISWKMRNVRVRAQGKMRALVHRMI
jgi:orotate phosphoribosyltransferase